MSAATLDRLRRLVTHPWLAFAFRLYIGGLFIYASMYKINYASEFAQTIASYRIVPWFAVNFMAVVLPWLELLCGILMVAGVRLKAAAAVIATLLAMFTLAIIVNLLRDSEISCGCFHTIEDPISWWTVLRDSAWVAMTLHVYHFDRILHLDSLLMRDFRELQT